MTTVTFQNEVDVPYIYFYDASEGTYGSNLAGASFDYFPDDAEAGDYICFGITGNQGYYHTLKLNIGTALVATSISVVWEYTDNPYGNPATWSEIPADRLQDLSNGFQNAGVQYVGFNLFPPAGGTFTKLWSSARYSMPIGYRLWIRCRIVSVSGLTEGGANQTTPPKFYDQKAQITGTGSSFDDLVTADKSGTFTLMYPEAAATNLNVLFQPRPQEWGATKIQCVITGYSASGNVVLTGKDEADNAITETIAITGNGTFTSTKAFKTIDSNGVDCTGTYTIELRQPRWGVFGKFGNMWQFSQVVLYIGDGSTATDITETGGHLRLEYSGLYSNTNATLTLGNKDATYEYPNVPFMIEWYNSGGQSADYGWLSPGIYLRDVNLYNVIYCNYGSYTRFQFVSANTTIKRFSAPKGSLYYIYFSGDAASGTYSDIAIPQIYQSMGGLPVWNDLKLKGGGIGGGFLYSSPPANTPDVATRLVRPEFEGNTRDVCHYSRGNGIVIVDPVNPLVTSKLGGNMSKSGYTYRIWLYYTLNIKVIDQNGNGIEMATVTVKNKDDDEQFSVTTDGNGDITPQEVLTALWSHECDQSGFGYKSYTDEEKTDYNDFTLEIKKAGYQTYTKKFTLDKKIDWVIRLKRISINIDSEVIL